MFAGMASVDATGMRLPRVPDGSHLLVIDRCLIPQAQGQGNAFVVEFTVQQSHNPNLPPGAKCSAYMSSKFRDSWLKQVKAFVAAGCGFDLRVPEQDAAFGPYSENATGACVGEHNVLANRVVVCEASFSGKYDKKQLPYFNYVWWPYGEVMNMQALPQASAYRPPQQPAYPPQGAPPGTPNYPIAYGAPPQYPAPQYGAPPPNAAWGNPPGQAPAQQGGPPQGSPFGGWRR